jgi:hypothetical protein
MNKLIRYAIPSSVAVMSILLATTWVTFAHGEATPTPDPNTPQGESVGFVPTYYENIAPILEANCTTCHSEGEFGHDSFEMDTPEEIVEGADDIALVVSTRYMPPWPPSSDENPHFLYDRSLSDQAIAEIVAWAEAGAPLGDPTLASAAIEPPPAPVISADLTLQMPEPYTPSNELNDDYRCFLIDPGFTEPTFITGYNIIPDNIGIVHHTVLFPGAPSQRSEADRLNGADGQPGWSCFGGSGLSTGGPDLGMLRPLLPIFQYVGGLGGMQDLLRSEDAAAQLDAAVAAIDTDGSLAAMVNRVGGSAALVGLLSQGLLGDPANSNPEVTGVIGAWVPGSVPTHFPENTGLLVPAGGFIVMQMHYNTQANDDPDQSTIILDTTNATDLDPLRVLAINAPVEIPCPEGVTGESCNRETHPFEDSDLLLAVCGQYLEDFADQDPTNAINYCDFRVPTSGWLVSIMSHQHKLGKSTNTILNPGTPNEQLIMDIPVWDFNWQGNYFYEEPIWVNANDTIRVTCVWDNSVSRSNPEPRYITVGEGTNDEMCLNFVTMLPAEEGSNPPFIDVNYGN